jgi:hypothetical protein
MVILPPEKELPILIEKEFQWAPKPLWMRWRIQLFDPDEKQTSVVQVIILPLYRVTYPGCYVIEYTLRDMSGCIKKSVLIKSLKEGYFI